MNPLASYIEVNVVCLLVCFVLFTWFVHEARHSVRGDVFCWTLIVIGVFCLSDIAAIALKGQTFPGAICLLYISNIIYAVSAIVIGFLWCVLSTIILRGRVKKSVLVIAGILCGIVALINFITPWTGWIFRIDENGIYSRGPLVWINFLYVIPASIVPAICSIWSKADRRSKLAVIFYPIAPLVAMIIQFCFYGISTGQVGATMSALMVFVMIQGSEMSDHKLRAKVYDELANTDALTGLNNRRAYEARLNASQKKEWVGVVFFDINGLKVANDTKGHQAGDDLIRSVVAFLKRFFPASDLYRISGDEFVAFTEDKETFRFKLSEIKRSNPGFVASGSGDGEGASAIETVRKAEAEMYKDKAEYYKSSGKNRRKR